MGEGGPACKGDQVTAEAGAARMRIFLEGAPPPSSNMVSRHLK
jgi:hypothetical protein